MYHWCNHIYARLINVRLCGMSVQADLFVLKIWKGKNVNNSDHSQLTILTPDPSI